MSRTDVSERTRRRILPVAVLGRSSMNCTLLTNGHGPKLFGHVIDKLLGQVLGWVHALVQDDKEFYGLAFYFVWHANGGGLGNGLVGGGRAFQLRAVPSRCPATFMTSSARP